MVSTKNEVMLLLLLTNLNVNVFKIPAIMTRGTN